MSERSEDYIEVKDHSRPFYQRKNGRIGFYIDVYEATPENPKRFGSEQYFLMSLKDNLADYLDTADLVKAKGVLEKKNVCKGVILEKFENGLVLTLAFDYPEAIEGIWKLHNAKKLSALAQEMFIDATVLKELQARKIVLQARLWEDEYNDCKLDLVMSGMERIHIKKSQNGVSMIKRLRQSQRTLQELVHKCREKEVDFDKNLGDFILEVKKMLPTNVTYIANIKELTTNLKMAKGANNTQYNQIDQYIDLLDDLRKTLTETEHLIMFPLAQIHAVCESDNQRLMKKAIYDLHADTVKRLKNDHDLSKIVHKESENKILYRERQLLLGLVSLVPNTLERMVDMDHVVDEYITEFPDKLRN